MGQSQQLKFDDINMTGIMPNSSMLPQQPHHNKLRSINRGQGNLMNNNNSNTSNNNNNKSRNSSGRTGNGRN